MGWPGLQDNLLSCSLDGTVKIWQAVETPAPGAVLDPAPVYVHPPETAVRPPPPPPIDIALPTTRAAAFMHDWGIAHAHEPGQPDACLKVVLLLEPSPQAVQVNHKLYVPMVHLISGWWCVDWHSQMNCSQHL